MRLNLRDAVMEALAKQAEMEHRDTKRQAEVNIERELQRVGLLPADQPTPPNGATPATPGDTT